MARISTITTQAPASTSKLLGNVGANTRTFDAEQLLGIPITAQGDLIIGDSSNNTTRLAAGSSGQILGLSTGIPTWVEPSTTYHPDQPPGTAGAGDDEFVTSLAGTWTSTGLSSGAIGTTWVSTGSNTYDSGYMSGSLAISLAGTTVTLTTANIIKAWAPDTTNAWSVSMKLHIPAITTATHGCGITLGDSSNLTSGVSIRAIYRAFSTASAIFHGLTSAESVFLIDASNPNAHVFDPIYLGILSPAASSVVYFYYSKDGIGWKGLGNTTHSHTISHLGIGFDKSNAFDTPVVPIVIDWIRTSTGANLKMGA